MNELKTIKAPNLNSVQYGNDINDVMDNINHNFNILSNYDFVKGERGNSIHISTLNLKNRSDILSQLKDAVLSQYEGNTPKTIGGISVLDFFENPGSISLIYEEVDGMDKLISSLPYTFKDLRFQNMNGGNIKQYDNEIDYSCIITYNGGEFVPLQVFPTIYYDAAVGTFCWIINGNKTGLEAQGPRGFEGKAGVFKTVSVVKDGNSESIYKISSILYNGSWVNTDTSLEGYDHAKVCEKYGVTAGTPVMAIIEDADHNNTIYLSETYVDADETTGSNSMLVLCNNLNRIFDVRPIQNVTGICEEVWGSI